MTELAAPLSLPAREEAVLGRLVSVSVRVNREIAAYAALLIVATGMRFWDLGSRAIHHDESLHAWTAWKLLDGQGYEHEPWMHGPFQFFGTAFSFFAFGESDYAVRILLAVFGSALIVLPWFLRRRLGTAGALLVAGAIAFSPTLLVMSRFAHPDIYMAFFTLGLVVCLWRYIDERKPRYLYVGALLLSLAFATKVSIFINATVLIAFLNIWLGVHFWRQVRDHNKLDAFTAANVLVWLVPFAWVVAALWPFTRRLRSRFGLNQWHPAADFLILLGTLCLPQFAAAIQVPLASVFGVHDAELAQRTGIRLDGISNPTRENLVGFFTILALVGATAFIGVRWNRRAWPLIAAAFYIPYALLYTSFFTNLDGFYSGNWGALNYWLDQQEVARGQQPWFYYLMLLPAYEFLPLLFAAPALFYYAVKGDVFRRFLVFWAVTVLLGYSYAGEKMPWLSVNTSLPVVVLGAFALGELISWQVPRRGARSLEPYLPLLAAGALGLTAVAAGVLAPAGIAWVALRILVVVFACLGILLLLLPAHYRQTIAVELGLSARRRRGRQPSLLRHDVVMGSAVFAGGLLALTLFVGVRAAYQYGDVPREMLVYTQTSPFVPNIVDSIDAAARDSGLNEDLPIVIEGGIEPWTWYLRDYKKINYTTVNAGFDPPPGSVLVLLAESESDVQAHLSEYQTPPVRFPLRWWFPESETYKTLPSADVYRGFPSPSSVVNFGDYFVGSLFRAGTWGNWWDFLRHRRTSLDGAPEDNFGRLNMVAYFPKQYAVTLPGGESTPGVPSTTAFPPPPLPPERLLTANLVLGKTGSEPGSFDEPAGLTLDAAGNLYVTDVRNHRIQKFDLEGKFLSQVGGNGSGEGQFQDPWGVAVDAQGNVWVADTFNHRIQKFDPNLKFVLAFGKPTTSQQNPEPDAFWGPRDVAIDPQGNVWVADTGTNRVVKYSSSGTFLQEFGDLGDGPGRFSEPTAIEISGGGDIFVADSGNRRVQRFNASFDFVAEFDIPGWLFVNPVAKPYIALLPDGGLVVSDPTQNKLFRLDLSGTPVATFDAEGTALVVPRGVAFDGRGYLYVAENEPDQVRRLVSGPVP